MKHTFIKIIFCITAIILSPLIWAQDIIVTNDAKKIEAKILEVSNSEIRYKEADNLDGPTFVIDTKEINSIIFTNGKVVLYNQPARTELTDENTNISYKPTVNESTADILLVSGDIIRGQITALKSDYVGYILEGKSYTLPASQVENVTFIQNGQVKQYGGISTSATAKNNTEISTSSNSPKSGRIYRDNGQYLYNDIYISSKEVERILKKENESAYRQWQKADGMLIGGSICAGIGGGLVLGGLFSLINRQYMTCIGIECTALVPLGIGLGLTLGASSQYNKAIDIYNSKFDHTEVQLKWHVSAQGVGLALAF